jgi:hypothetical protein
VRLHVPVAGNPLKVTLPVEFAHVGWVMVPITGADGAEGGVVITTLAEDADTHPSALATIKLYVPGTRPITVVVVPLPVVMIAPGLWVNVHVPEDGNPLRFTLPVPKEQVGGTMVPTTGAGGMALIVNI